MEKKDLTPELAKQLADLDNKVYMFLEQHEKEHPGNFYVSYGTFDYGFKYFKDETIVPDFVLKYIEESNRATMIAQEAIKKMVKHKNPKFSKK